jgi:hypothetical protein
MLHTRAVTASHRPGRSDSRTLVSVNRVRFHLKVRLFLGTEVLLWGMCLTGLSVSKSM